jgi:hypothetical protein
VLRLKTRDAVEIEGFLPSGKFFLGEHVTLVGVCSCECPAANCDHDQSFVVRTPSLPTGWWQKGFEHTGGPFRQSESWHGTGNAKKITPFSFKSLKISIKLLVNLQRLP